MKKMTYNFLGELDNAKHYLACIWHFLLTKLAGAILQGYLHHYIEIYVVVQIANQLTQS
jgi:hypothetical protein